MDKINGTIYQMQTQFDRNTREYGTPFMPQEIVHDATGKPTMDEIENSRLADMAAKLGVKRSKAIIKGSASPLKEIGEISPSYSISASY